jgi:hypothetical protein
VYRNHVTAVLGVVVFIGAFSMAGCSSAAPKAAAGGNTSVATAMKDNSANSGGTRILVYSINSDGADFRSIVTGAIGDYGPAVTVYPDGKADPTHSSQLAQG